MQLNTSYIEQPGRVRQDPNGFRGNRNPKWGVSAGRGGRGSLAFKEKKKIAKKFLQENG